MPGPLLREDGNVLSCIFLDLPGLPVNIAAAPAGESLVAAAPAAAAAAGNTYLLAELAADPIAPATFPAVLLALRQALDAIAGVIPAGEVEGATSERSSVLGILAIENC